MIDLEKIGSLIRKIAAEEVMPRWQKLEQHEISQKTGPKDLVTVADREAEKALTPLLMQALPGSLVVGEEGVAADPANFRYLQSDKPVWIVDPVDGTMAFSEGRREFDVMVALAKGNKILAGWIYAPIDDDLYMAAQGTGMLRSHRVSTTSEVQTLPLKPVKIGDDIKDYTGILGKASFSDDESERLKTKAPHFKKWTSTVCAGHDYARLARGEAQFAVYNKCMPWDHVPGLALLQEIGYKYARFDGGAYRMDDPHGGLLVAPEKEWDIIRGVLFG